MARLTKSEREQLRRPVRDTIQPGPKKPASVSEYVAFATFASRLARVAKPKPIVGGEHWKL